MLKLMIVWCNGAMYAIPDSASITYIKGMDVCHVESVFYFTFIKENADFNMTYKDLINVND